MLLKKIRQFIFPFERKDAMLGVARGPRRYDLPLSHGEGNNFLRLLVALMSVLGMLALAASFALSAMTERWSQGLKDKVSVEIPATDSNAEPVAPDMVREMTKAAQKVLSESPDVIEASVVEERRIRELLAPWLGADISQETIPLPGLVSVTFKKGANPDLKALEGNVREVAPRARIDGHESWLKDVLKFTASLQFAAALLTIIIGLTTLVAVASGVRSKLSENKEELELLHLMGASDSYIARQIQRHTMIVSAQGGAGGIVAGGIILFIIGLAAGHAGVNLVPGFTLSAVQKAMLLLLPLPIAGLAMGTARVTVLRVLTKMP